MPSWIATMLREWTSPSRIVIAMFVGTPSFHVFRPQNFPSISCGLYSSLVTSGMSSAVSGTIVLAEMLSSIAFAYTIGLIDEPGCRSAVVARSNGARW